MWFKERESWSREWRMVEGREDIGGEEGMFDIEPLLGMRCTVVFIKGKG